MPDILSSSCRFAPLSYASAQNTAWIGIFLPPERFAPLAVFAALIFRFGRVFLSSGVGICVSLWILFLSHSSPPWVFVCVVTSIIPRLLWLFYLSCSMFTTNPARLDNVINHPCDIAFFPLHLSFGAILNEKYRWDYYILDSSKRQYTEDVFWKVSSKKGLQYTNVCAIITITEQTF